MSKKNFVYVAIAVIAALFFTSCERYQTQQPLAEKDAAQNAVWKPMVTDSIKKDMLHYFMILGDKNTPTVSEVIIHKQLGTLHVPDELIKDVPDYYTCFQLGEQMIAEKEVHRSSGPTLWKAPQATFTLKVMDPVSFDQATITVVTRDATIFCQVILIFFFAFFGFLAFLLFNAADGNKGWGIFWSFVAIGILVWAWFYVAYFVSVLCTLLFVSAVLAEIVWHVNVEYKKNKKSKA